MKQVQLDVTRNPIQKVAWDVLDDPGVRRLLYGGAKGGGKSWFLVVWLFCSVWAIMVKARLQVSKNPPHVAWFGRKQATDFTQTTLQTWREWIPEEYYQIKGATERDPKHILIANRIAIDYGGLDKQENINKFNSAEYIIICVDQAEEVSQDDMGTVRGSLRMVLKDKKGKPIDIPFKELYTANPRQCWLKPEFITKPKANARFVPALPADNPKLPADYVQTLTDAFEHRPELLRAYLKGDWAALEGADIIIKSLWVEQAAERTFYPSNPRELLVCDVARFGDNETVIYHLRETEIVSEMIYGQKDTYFTSNLLMKMSDKAGGIPIVVDECGVGGGVVDNLRGHEGYEVHGIDSQAKADDPEKYYNVRAQMWWEAGRGFSDGDIALHTKDDILTNQLSTLTYSFRNGRILVMSSDDVKIEHGRHLDRACAYIMGLYGLKWAKVPMNIRSSVRKRDRWDRKPRKTTAMAS